MVLPLILGLFFLHVGLLGHKNIIFDTPELIAGFESRSCGDHG